MRILRFNESHTKTEYDFEEIFFPLTDNGLSFELKNLYFHRTDDTRWRVHPNEAYTRPGYLISFKGQGRLDISTISYITGELDEIISRLSTSGSCSLKKLLFSDPGGDNEPKTEIEFLLVDKSAEEEKPNEKEGFYEFVEALRRAFTVAFNNKITRSFDFKQGKEGVILTPKEGIDPKPLMSQLRRFVRNFFSNNTHFTITWNYDIVLDESGKVFINYNSRVDRRNR